MLSLQATFLTPTPTAAAAPARQSSPPSTFANALKAHTQHEPTTKPPQPSGEADAGPDKADNGDNGDNGDNSDNSDIGNSRVDDGTPTASPPARPRAHQAAGPQPPHAQGQRRPEQRPGGAGPDPHGQPVPLGLDPTTPTLDPALAASLLTDASTRAEPDGERLSDDTTTSLPTDPGAAAMAALLAATARPMAVADTPVPTGGDAKTQALQPGGQTRGTDPLAGAQRGTAQRHEPQDHMGFRGALPEAAAAAAAAAAPTASALPGPLASALAAFTRGQAAGQAPGGSLPEEAQPEAAADIALAGSTRAGQPRAAGRGEADALGADALGGPKRTLAGDAARSDAGTTLDPITLAPGQEPGKGRALAPSGDAAAALQGPQGGTAAPQGTAPSSAVAQARVDVPVHQPGFGPALGAQVSLLVRDGVQEAKLQLHPVEMGPITVQIALNGGAARIDFQAEVAATRSAIEASLPALAGALQDAGFTLTGGGVSQHGGQSGQPAPGDGRPRGNAENTGGRNLPPDTATAPVGARASAAASRGLVDLVA